MNFKKLLAALMLLVCLCTSALADWPVEIIHSAQYPVIQEGWYESREEVAVYLDTYGKLPGNYLTKKEAQNLGWVSKWGNLDEVAPGQSIGGDRFGNYEGQLPEAKGRTWKECDIDYDSGTRNGLCILFSNDGLIYYTDDHYNTFIQLIVEEESKEVEVKKNGKYTSKEEVAAYLNAYGKLPKNYLTKEQAQKKGWSSKKNNLGQVAPGYAIGGDVFQNREKLLPSKKGRTWQECDVNVVDGKRSKERLVYSNDGLIYYTADSFKSFIQLY
ncbi:MAG: hypothetical protein IJ461_08060 [Clostridia bacterium]|nr:hypothetical protein [Clostridia bacterium]